MATKTDMIEKVARAIWDDACPGMEWGEIDRLSYRGWAQAAIEAMREPTDECWEAARHAVLEGHGLPNGREIYRAVIDAALASA